MIAPYKFTWWLQHSLAIRSKPISINLKNDFCSAFETDRMPISIELYHTIRQTFIRMAIELYDERSRIVYLVTRAHLYANDVKSFWKWQTTVWSTIFAFIQNSSNLWLFAEWVLWWGWSGQWHLLYFSCWFVLSDLVVNANNWSATAVSSMHMYIVFTRQLFAGSVLRTHEIVTFVLLVKYYNDIVLTFRRSPAIPTSTNKNDSFTSLCFEILWAYYFELNRKWTETGLRAT